MLSKTFPIVGKSAIGLYEFIFDLSRLFDLRIIFNFANFHLSGNFLDRRQLFNKLYIIFLLLAHTAFIISDTKLSKPGALFDFNLPIAVPIS